MAEFALNIYQPMMFVGLGGTGCAIGTELERRLRQTLCGPDGMAFAERMSVNGNTGYLPYQLPGCVQFVYADLDETELDRVHHVTVPGAAHQKAAERNAHLVRNLVPRFRTYSEVAANLRMAAADFVHTWLPPVQGEPLVSPISKGAGQLPTVGRAALFETVREDVGPAQQPLLAGIDAIARAGAELTILGGRSSRTVDVFVAFSVAGGTGAGIFYDYLHLIADAFKRRRIGVQIYPLVLMPSAFDEGKGGGRSADLNAGRALLDLFRLIDDQNARKSTTELRASDRLGRPVDVAYPKRKIEIEPGIVQTGFLFSKTAGMEKEDIHRSIASLILSLISAQPPAEAGQQGQTYQSFADSFINAAATRNTPADSGIGYRGVSTGLVASLTVPGDDLAELVAGRLLARAVPMLDVPPAGGTEQNVPLIGQLARVANLGEIVDRPDLPLSAPRQVDGAAEITRSLTDYSDSIGAVLRAQEFQFNQRTQEMAGVKFQPVEAAKAMLRDTDVFRLQRVLRGHPALTDPNDRNGLIGLLEARKGVPSQPPGRPPVSAAAPMLPAVRNKLGSRAKWGDPQVQLALTTLRDWHRWNTWRLWHQAWGGQSQVWQPKLAAAVTMVDDFAEALRVFARGEQTAFDRKTMALSRDANGIRQLLPAGGNLDVFYRTVLRRFIQRAHLPEGTQEPEVVRGLLRGQDWQKAFEEITEHGHPQRAVASLRDRLKQEVKTLFDEAEGSSVPLLPSMSRLLARAANPAAPDVDPVDLRTFEDHLRALLPAGFNPQGSGQLKVLIAHPDVKQAASGDVQGHLRQALTLPFEGNRIDDFRPGQADSITAVLFRSSMAINEVDEVRELIRDWSDASQTNDEADYLLWRQRLGYTSGWLAMTDDDRVLMLHRLLCAMWNGQVAVDGPLESPRSITVQAVGNPHALPMQLVLRRVGPTSSWGYLLRAYELWVVEDDTEARRQFTRSLRTVKPKGLTSYPEPPSEVYRTFAEVAAEEAIRVTKFRDGLPPTSRALADQLVEFWTATFPAAESRRFQDLNVVAGNLRELSEYVSSME
jgi:hypothetical protein